MRITITRDDPDNWLRKGFAWGMSVVLDGEVQREVVEADEEAGYVDRLAIGENGRLVEALDEDGQLGAVIERVEGQVTIVPFPLL